MKKRILLLIFLILAGVSLLSIIFSLSSYQTTIKIFHLLPENFRDKIESSVENTYHKFPEKLKIVLKIYNTKLFRKFYVHYLIGKKDENESFVKNFKNDYNVNFLPNTQFIKVNFSLKNLNFLTNHYTKSGKLVENITGSIQFKYSYYIELIDKEKLLITDMGANFFEIKYEKIKNNEIKPKIINSNLTNVGILGTLIHKENLYVSYIKENDSEGKKCSNFGISVAKYNSEYLNFKNFFNPEECGGRYVNGGKMKFITHQNKDGLLFTTDDGISDRPDEKPQSETSIFGKILFVDFNEKNYEIYSKGHRTSQGLYVDGSLVLTTEHGPKGGDEINKIIFGQNYGWPISSYGDRYVPKQLIKPKYKKDHASLNFKEPIFSFVPSIAISELIRLPNSFSEHWKDNFLIASLNGRSLYRVKFDKNYEKILFYEKIFIGQRIRDLKYHKESESIFLALEDMGQLGIITNEQ